MPEYAGHLLFHVSRGNDGRCVLSTVSTRPVHTANLFRNKTCRTALSLVPRLYSLCALAQGVAAVTVTETALGTGSDSEARLQREILVAIETIREHLWRKLVHWRELTGLEADISRFSALNSAANSLIQGINPGYCLMSEPAAGAVIGLERLKPDFLTFYALAEESLGETRYLLAKRPGDHHPEFTHLIVNKWDRLGDGNESPLDGLSFSALSAKLASDDANGFIAAPEWDGQPRETGSLPRMLKDPAFKAWCRIHGTGLYGRWLAPLLETRMLLDWLFCTFDDREMNLDFPYGLSSTERQPDGSALCTVESARGCLLHRLELKRDTVVNYQILAPTEWNFHPRGCLAQMVRALPFNDPEIERKVRALVLAIDPCVAFQVHVTG
ncbi:nickel-dependent hydrogenase large subunit [Parasalinivibrio latis]|uniref:nickel-dependent hydrogenase large subunit n=1 Tax=Parasalinivibrio latis TaxID=2952610 RepID=UPI0030E0A1B5